jgi:hypothetical protein
VHPGLTPTTTAAFDQATGQYSRIISVVDPTVNLRLDPRTRSPQTDQLGVGVERELATRLSIGASYVHKNGSDFIGWTDTGGIYEASTRTLPNGRVVPVLVLTNGTAARRFLLTNPSGYFLRYNGMVLTVDKRWSDGWQAFASYTVSKTEGLQPSSGLSPGQGQFSSTFGGNPFGRDPNTLTNAIGRLSDDRTHVLRVMGSLPIPRTGVVFATNFQYLTGLPWAATAQVNLPQGGVARILLETPGTRRLSSQTLMDIRLSRAIELARKTRIELLLDVFNTFNRLPKSSLPTTICSARISGVPVSSSTHDGLCSASGFHSRNSDRQSWLATHQPQGAVHADNAPATHSGTRNSSDGRAVCLHLRLFRTCRAQRRSVLWNRQQPRRRRQARIDRGPRSERRHDYADRGDRHVWLHVRCALQPGNLVQRLRPRRLC